MKRLILALVAQQQTINVGGSANDGTGDTLRTAFTKTNANFAALFSALAGKAASIHTHVIGDVTGLQAALTGKQPLSANLTTLSAYTGVGTTAGTLAAGNDSRIVNATQNGGTASFTTLSANALTLGTPLPLSQGGCGATSALGCLSNLGLAGGTAGYALTSNGPGTAPTYQPVAGGSANAVLFTTQTLTSGQQLQARQNIAAVASGDNITLGSASVATTQAANDNSTKPATTAYADRAAAASGTTLIANVTVGTATPTVDVTLPTTGYSSFRVKVVGLSLSASAASFGARFSDNGTSGVKAGAADYQMIRTTAQSGGTSVAAPQDSYGHLALSLNSGQVMRPVLTYTFYPGATGQGPSMLGQTLRLDTTPASTIDQIGIFYAGGTSGSMGRANLIRFYSTANINPGTVITVWGEP